MKSNTEIKYIDSNGNNCSPLPIIETTITDPNNLPLKSGIYRNTSSGFGTISYNNNVYLYNEVKQEVPDISSNGGIIIFQEAYVFMANIMPIIFKRFGYQSPLGTSISWSGWNYSIEGSSIVAGKLGTATKGSPTNPIYLMNGTPYISTSTVGSATKPIYMKAGTLTECSLPYSNENLLINPDFTINQRGSSIYYGSSTTSAYTVDRWCLLAAAASYNFTPNTGSGASFVSTLVSGNLVQYIENPLELSTTYTLSVNTAGGTVSGTFTTPSSLPTSVTSYVILTITNSGTVGYAYVRYETTKSCWSVMLNVASSKTMTLNWVKLEKGGIATPFATPTIETELAKCQRYFYKARLNINATSASTTTLLYPEVFLPVSMRIKPTIAVSTGFAVRGEGKEIESAVTNVTPDTFDNNTNFLKLKITTTSATLTKWQCYSFHNGTIAFDAEI